MLFREVGSAETDIFWTEGAMHIVRISLCSAGVAFLNAIWIPEASSAQRQQQAPPPPPPRQQPVMQPVTTPRPVQQHQVPIQQQPRSSNPTITSRTHPSTTTTLPQSPRSQLYQFVAPPV